MFGAYGGLGSDRHEHVTPAGALAGVIEHRQGRRPSYPGSDRWMAPLLVVAVLEQLMDADDPPSRFDADAGVPEWLWKALDGVGLNRYRRCKVGERGQPALSYGARFRVAVAAAREALIEDFDAAEADFADLMELRAELLSALAAGRVRAWGVRGDAREGTHAEPVPPEAFAAPVTLAPDALGCTVAGEDAPPLWRSLLVSRADVAKAFGMVPSVDTTAAGPAVASLHTTEPVLGDNRPTAAENPANAGTAAAGGQKAAPKYSEAALAAWMMLRVHTWPAENAPPSEAECQAEANAYFARNVPREHLRRVRRDKAPQSWLKPGRRPPR